MKSPRRGLRMLELMKETSYIEFASQYMGNILNQTIQSVNLPYLISPQRVYQRQGYCVASSTGSLPLPRMESELNLHKVSVIKCDFRRSSRYFIKNCVSLSDVGNAIKYYWHGV